MFRRWASSALDFVLEVVLHDRATPCYDHRQSFMNPTLFIRLCVTGLIVLGGVYLVVKLPSMDVGSQFVITVIGGTILGILAVKYVVPRIGDAVGTLFYSSGETIGPDNSVVASAKVAQGDYAGAIAEYEALLKEEPDNTLFIYEIAKIRAHMLDDPQSALNFLQEQLEGRDWTEDDAAFLMFRIAELHVDAFSDFTSAESVLQQVIAEFPNTRHSANAHHRIHEVQHAQMKARSHFHPKPGASS